MVSTYSFGPVVLVVLIFFLIVFAPYYFGISGIIRATRIPQSPRLHPGRGHISAVLVLLGLLIPFILLSVSLVTIRFIEFPQYQTRTAFYHNHHQEEMQRHGELVGAIGKVQMDHLERMNVLDRNNAEQRTAWNAYSATVAKLEDDIKRAEIIFRRAADDSRNMMYGTPHVGGVSVGACVYPLLFFALPGTILGIGYVSRIRKEHERPGLASGLFAALTFPIMIVLGTAVGLILAFGWTGFLIMFTVLGILVGVYFAVRYWLAR